MEVNKNETDVSFFEDFHQPKKQCLISDIFKEIDEGKYKSQIESIRVAILKGELSKAKKIKHKLPSFTPSATFVKKRNHSSIKSYSNIIHLDFDKIPEEKITEFKDVISNVPNTYACFISPSGNGLKVFVKVDSSQDGHSVAYKQVENYYNRKIGIQADSACKDVTRLCFMSYDPEIYINKESEVFKIDDTIIENEALYKEGTVGLGKRNNYLLKVAGMLKSKGLSDATIVAALIEENKTQCKPPLGKSEVLRISNSIKRYNSGKRVDVEVKKTPPEERDIDEKIKYGITGELLDVVMPHTEAHTMAIVINFLVGFGNIIGRKAHFEVEADKHFTNLNTCLVGDTSKGRKGTSWGYIKRLFSKIDQRWLENRVKNGLSSGEGLINEVRDEVMSWDKKKQDFVIKDIGVKDKRLLVVQSEFGSVLKLTSLPSNILSNVVRDSWDSGILRTLTKTSPLKATNAHISLIGHITSEELIRYMSETESSNGFANRFLWIYVKRSKILPHGGSLNLDDFNVITDKILDCIDWLKSLESGLITRDDSANKLWEEVYEDLSEGLEGLIGKVTSRSESQVLRLSLIYAVLDKSEKIKTHHLQAALGIWSYCMRTAEYIWGNKMGSGLIGSILESIKENEKGLSKTEIHRLFNNHMTNQKINSAVSFLIQKGLIVKHVQTTAGRNKEIYLMK